VTGVTWRELWLAGAKLIREVDEAVDRLFTEGTAALQIAVVRPEVCYAGFYTEAVCDRLRITVRGREVEVEPSPAGAACTIKVYCPERLPEDTELEYDLFSYGDVSVFPGRAVYITVATVCEGEMRSRQCRDVRLVIRVDSTDLQIGLVGSSPIRDMDAVAGIRRVIEELTSGGPGREITWLRDAEAVLVTLREAGEALRVVGRAVVGCRPAAEYVASLLKTLP